jgi:hypothetical protein
MFLLMQTREQEWPSYSTDKGDSGAASHDAYFYSPVATHGYSASKNKLCSFESKSNINKACVLFCHARGPTRHRHSSCNASAAVDAVWLAAAWQRGLLAHLFALPPLPWHHCYHHFSQIQNPLPLARCKKPSPSSSSDKIPYTAP